MKQSTLFANRRVQRWVAPILAAVLLAAWHIAPAHAETRQQQALRGIAALDQRVASLAHRLATAGVELCSDRTPLPGFTVHHLSQYSGSFQDAARQEFGLGQGAQVLATATGGPAQRAGLRSNDPILTVDGKALPRGMANEPSSVVLIEEVQRHLNEGFADGAAALVVLRDGEPEKIWIEAEMGCTSRVNLKPSSDLNAHADGTHVIITTAIAATARDDAELAAVLAHELAHNILGHRARLDAAGRSGRLVRQTEIEADRLSVHLLHRAGIDPRAAIRFWQHHGPRQESLFSGSGHPNWRRRSKIMAEEIDNLPGQESSRLSAPG